MNSVRTADLRCAAEFVRAQIEDFAKDHEVALDDLRRVANLQRLRSIDDVVGRHPVMQPARGQRITNRFADGHRESDDIVLHARFDVVDAGGVSLGIGPQLCGDVFRHDSGFGKRFGRGELNLEPLGVFVRVAPDAAHFRPGVTWNHDTSPARRRLSYKARFLISIWTSYRSAGIW